MDDLKSREDIELLVNAFYDKVQKDETIGYIFTEVAALDWSLHLPKMYSFWESILFGKGSYKDNPMEKHIALNKKEKLEAIHFDKWKELWSATVSSNFSGRKADEAIKRAESIAGLMLFKVSND